MTHFYISKTLEGTEGLDCIGLQNLGANLQKEKTRDLVLHAYFPRIILIHPSLNLPKEGLDRPALARVQKKKKRRNQGVGAKRRWKVGCTVTP